MKNTAVWMASTLHLFWAGLLIFDTAPERVTGLNLLHQVFPNRQLLIIVLISFSILAIRAVYRPDGVKSLMMILPQQFLLVIAAIAVIQTIALGHFADGVMRPRTFLAADKASVVLIALFHSFVLLNFHKMKGNHDISII
ncbi:MAG: hypothetical protein EPO02_13550 [Nitrospirae bacterium]|nr:MAG: hypothetical protein EPO02_13550 [Nitrospirota bacterium]